MREEKELKSYAIGLYEKAIPSSMTWREKLECARECEFDFLEISIDQTDEKLARLDWPDQQISKLIKDMKETEMPIASMCLAGHKRFPFGSSNPGVRERSMEMMEKALDLADSLGIRIIQLQGYDVFYEDSTKESKALFLENLKRATMMAARQGIVLGIETMDTEFMNTVWKSMFWVQQVNSPFLGLYPDAGNLTNANIAYGTNFLDDLESGRGHIVALHLKDTAPGKFRDIPFFAGHVDFDAVIEKAWDLGIRRYATEMWDVGSASWKVDIQTANSNMRAILDRQTKGCSRSQ